MIALPQDLPLVRWQNKRNIPLSEGWVAESIDCSAFRAGYEQWEWTPDITQALSFYLRKEFHGCLISSSELQVLIKKTLLSIGYPDVADQLTLVAPRVTISLPEIARAARFELLFFQLLRERLEEASRVVVRGIKLEGLRRCVKTLQQAGRWQGNCETLSTDIVNFVRQKLSQDGCPAVEIIIL